MSTADHIVDVPKKLPHEVRRVMVQFPEEEADAVLMELNELVEAGASELVVKAAGRLASAISLDQAAKDLGIG